MSRTHRTTLLRALVATALLVLAACTGAPSTSQAGTPSAGSVSRAVSVPAPRAAPRTTAVIRTGDISLTSRRLDRVRAAVDRLLTSLGGTVDRENTTHRRDGSTDRSTLVLRVPVAEFDTAKRALERLGRLRSSTERQVDVTTRVIDTAERVQTLQNSLDRLQRFQRSAKDVRDLLRFEDQITERTSELQSMQAQQRYLRSRTSLSTITLRLSRPETYVAPPGALDHAGFLTGITTGWRALGAVAVVTLTVLGAVLPFLVLLGVAAGPLWLLLRRRGVTSASDTRQNA